MNIKFASIQAEKNVTAKFHRASSRTSICPSPSMDLKKRRTTAGGPSGPTSRTGGLDGSEHWYWG